MLDCHPLRIGADDYRFQLNEAIGDVSSPTIMGENTRLAPRDERKDSNFAVLHPPPSCSLGAVIHANLGTHRLSTARGLLDAATEGFT